MYRRFLTLAALCFGANEAAACGPETPCPLGDRHYRVFVPQGVTTPKGALVFAHGFRGSDEDTKRWSRKFGPVFKVDRMMKVTIRNEETQEPFARV